MKLLNKIDNLFLSLALALASALALTSCKEDPPVTPPTPPPTVIKDTITLSIEDLTHRSITINIKTTANIPQSTIKLFRQLNHSEELVSQFPITVKDTSIIDDNNGNGLQLNTSYNYLAVRIDTLGERKDSSNLIEAKTLDTTSHDYTWQEFTIGSEGALYDVWGTDENNVYACGGISINDTNYGIIHWDGNEWKPQRNAGGVAIFGFSANDIWTVGGSIFHFDGNQWNEALFLDSNLWGNIPYNCVWGTSSNNIYFGNAWGKIIHWDGNQASIVYDKPGFSIGDIYGTSSDNIMVVGTERTSPNRNLILHFNGISWEEDNTLPNTRFQPSGVYTRNENENVIVGQGIYFGSKGKWRKQYDPKFVFKGNVRGTSTNNIFISGGFSYLLHFNGFEMIFYPELFNPQGGDLLGIWLNENKIVIAGITSDNKAQIIIGTKN